MQITGWFAWRPHRRWLRPTITGVHQTPDSAAAIKLQVRIRMQLGGKPSWPKAKPADGMMTYHGYARGCESTLDASLLCCPDKINIGKEAVFSVAINTYVNSATRQVHGVACHPIALMRNLHGRR